MNQSIIITFHKDFEMLKYCIKRIRETAPNNIEIIVVANNVNHSEIEFNIDDPHCCIYRIYENIQYPAAVNIGVKACETEIMTIMDCDIFVWRGWNEALLDCLLNNPCVGAVGAKLINPQNDRILDFGIMYSKFNSAHSFLGLHYNHSLTTNNRKVQAVCSALLMTRKSIFEKVGGFDTDIPYAYTDCDYCIRLREAGYKVWAAANAMAYHKGNTDKNNSKSSFSYYRADAKAMYAMKDYRKLNYDIWDYYKYAADYAKINYKGIPRSFVLWDMTTLYDRKEYYSHIQKYLDIKFLDIIETPDTLRDNMHISLYTSKGFELINLSTPLLYFVDTFCGLINNSLWFTLRDIDDDLVIDRHGNIVPLKKIKFI